MKRFLLIGVLFLLFFSFGCTKSKKIDGYGQALGFSLTKDADGKAIAAEILSDGVVFSYEFCESEENSRRIDGSHRFRVAVPPQRVAVCTSTVLALLEAIGATESVVALDGDYTTVAVFREKIKQGAISFLSEGMALDREKLARVKPQIVFFSPAAGDQSELRKILECGAIPVPIHDWREDSPLGRSRWAELEAAFFGKSKEAAALFTETERRYLAVAEKNIDRRIQPQVLFHLPVNGQWRMPSGNSYMADAVCVAGGSCRLPDSSSKTVLLDLETVFVRFSEATVWLIHSGSFENRAAFEKAALSAFGDSRLTHFPPLKNARIAVNDRLVDERGYNGFYDYSPLFPDRLLEDLAAIIDGEEPTYFYRILK